MLGAGGQLAVADVEDAEQAAAAFLDGPFVVLFPHGVDEGAELFKRLKEIGHVDPAAGRREGRVVVGGEVGDVDGAELDAAHGFLLVAKLHAREELEVEGVVRVLLGQFHEFVVEDVGVVLGVGVHRRGDDDRDFGSGLRRGEGKPEGGEAEQAGDEKFFHDILLDRLKGRAAMFTSRKALPGKAAQARRKFRPTSWRGLPSWRARRP